MTPAVSGLTARVAEASRQYTEKDRLAVRQAAAEYVPATELRDFLGAGEAS